MHRLESNCAGKLTGIQTDAHAQLQSGAPTDWRIYRQMHLRTQGYRQTHRGIDRHTGIQTDTSLAFSRSGRNKSNRVIRGLYPI